MDLKDCESKEIQCGSMGYPLSVFLLFSKVTSQSLVNYMTNQTRF